MVFTRTCVTCDGTGSEKRRHCTACAGQGRASVSEGITVKIPAGVRDGARLRIAELGHSGRAGGRGGDLYVDIQVRPHPLLRREGDDLHMIVPVAIHEAALGARVELPSPDGAVQVRIPPGTRSGQRLRVSGRGAPSASGGRGDHGRAPVSSERETR
jgi:DnaJ-class molecular chaperone